MLTVEFLGTPYSGKSFFKQKLEEDKFFKDFELYSYRKNFYCNLNEIQKLNIFQKSILNFYCKKSFIEKKNIASLTKKKNSFIKNFIQNKVNNLVKFQSDIFKKKNLDLSNLIKYYFEKTELTPERLENLNRWINELFASYEISNSFKSNKKIIIDSEGFIHRVNSFVFNEYDHTFVENYLRMCPKPDILIYIDEDIKTIQDRITNSINEQEKEKYKNKIDDINENSKRILEEIKKYSSKIFLLNSKNFNEVKSEIINFIKTQNL